MTPRVLPVRVKPMPGEAIDSWIEATARSMDSTVGWVARRLDLPTQTRPPWLVSVSAEQLRSVEAATGILPETVGAMTLSTYNGTALQIDPVSQRLDPGFPFGLLAWSRYCPHCLTASGGRWQLRWRLGWSFACIEHHCLLVDRCPDCGRNPRRYLAFQQVPRPLWCQCGRDLSSAATLQLPVRHGIIEAQQQILEVITTGKTSIGVYGNTGAPARTALDGVRSLANRALNYASIHGLSAVTSADLTEFRDNPLVVERPPGRNALNVRPPARAIDTAVGVTAALDILSAPTVVKAMNRAVWVVASQNADNGPAELRSCARDADIPAAIVIGASRHRLGPELQLRFRTGISMPCPPDLDSSRVQEIAAGLPQQMWPAWSARLLPDVRRTAAMRTALSYAALLTGSTVPPGQAIALLGDDVSLNALNWRLWLLRSSAYWKSICAALVRLSDYLDRHGAPIDYRRRRSLDYSVLLPGAVWEDICHRSGGRLGDGRSGVARCYLSERLSGTSPQRLAPVLAEADARGLGGAVGTFRRAMSDYRMTLLDQHAEHFLAERGIDEPVTWHAPLDLVTDLGLPGP